MCMTRAEVFSSIYNCAVLASFLITVAFLELLLDWKFGKVNTRVPIASRKCRETVYVIIIKFYASYDSMVVTL